MKCFHFTNGDKREDAVVSRSSARVSWARSLSNASNSRDTTRRSEFDSDCASTDLSDSLQLSTRRRANHLQVFKFVELKLATRGFNRSLLIGEGGFGCVYRGVVHAAAHDNESDRSLHVAIKQLNRNGLQGHKEWINEVNFLGVVKHPNLVKLVGYCAEDDERGIQRLLVYELMRNKSLEDHLLGRGKSTLSWMTRLRIAEGAARGLAYLHEEMDFQDLSTKTIFGRGRESDGLYLLEHETPRSLACSSSSSPLVFHCRLGHPSFQNPKKLCPELFCLSSLQCESYQFAKHQHVHLGPRVNKRAASPFELILSCLGSLSCYF